MIHLVLALVLSAAPATGPATTAPESVKPVHHLQCEEAERLFDALERAGAAVKKFPDAQQITLAQLSCGMAKAPTAAETQVSCAMDKVSADGKAAKSVWAALAGADLQMTQATMKAVFAFSGVVCTARGAGVDCTLTNESVSVPLPASKNRDVREKASGPYEHPARTGCEPAPKKP